MRLTSYLPLRWIDSFAGFLSCSRSFEILASASTVVLETAGASPAGSPGAILNGSVQ